jgi:hypothetical protein
MDFELTNRQKQIRLAAREFAEGELVPLGKDCEAKGEYPREIIKKAAQLGFVGVYIKKEYGGLGLGLLNIVSSWRNSGGPSLGLAKYFLRRPLGPKNYYCLVLRNRRRNIFRLSSKVTGSWVLPSPSLKLEVMLPLTPPARKKLGMSM